MKKIVKYLLIGFVVLVVLGAIFGGESEEGSQGDSQDKPSTEGSNIVSGSESGDSNQNHQNGSDAPVGGATATSIEEQVILDRDGIVITAKEYVNDSIWGEGIKLLIENNREEAVTVSCKALIVNNYMISDLFVEDVAAGKKSNDVLYLSSSQLRASGIDTVGQVEIYFHVYNSETYDTIFDSDCVTVKTSDFDHMDTTVNVDGTELYHANGVRIVGMTVDENSFWGSAILLYCENNTDRDICISVEELSINGFMMSPFFTSTIFEGKMSCDEITIFSTDLEENEITTIDEVELKFHIYDADTYDTIADSDVIKFSAK